MTVEIKMTTRYITCVLDKAVKSLFENVMIAACGRRCCGHSRIVENKPFNEEEHVELMKWFRPIRGYISKNYNTIFEYRIQDKSEISKPDPAKDPDKKEFLISLYLNSKLPEEKAKELIEKIGNIIKDENLNATVDFILFRDIEPDVYEEKTSVNFEKLRKGLK
jgi:hypothetical protein